MIDSQKNDQRGIHARGLLEVANRTGQCNGQMKKDKQRLGMQYVNN